MKKNILIFGITGLLGSQLNLYLKNKKYKIIGVGYRQKDCHYSLNVTDYKKTFKLIKKIKPGIIINCIAFTDVDKCNIDFKNAYEKNVVSIYNIVNVLKILKVKTHLIHISTDQVYNNTKKKNKEENTKILNNYGLTKLIGEKQITNYKFATIIRTNFFGNSLYNRRKSYSDWIKINLKRQKKLLIPNNINFNPIHMFFLCEIIEKIINKKVFGTFNIGSKNGISKFDFVNMVAKKYNLNKKKISGFKSKENFHNRPLGTVMDTVKIEKALKIKIPKIEKSIDLLF